MPDSSPQAITEGKIQAAMVGLLYRQSNAVLFANFVIPLPVIYVLQQSLPLAPLLYWAAAIYILTAMRIGHSVRYFRQAPHLAEPLAWARRFMALSWLSSLLWGLVGSPLFMPHDPNLIAFSCIVLAGMSSGAIPSLSAHPATYVGSVSAMLLPFALTCLDQGEPVYRVYLGFTVCLYCVNLYYSRVTYRSLRDGVTLRFENLALIGQLERERDRATAADRAKTRFLAAASHDLRQPVHALGLFAATLSGLSRRGDVAAAQAGQIAERLRTTLRNMGDMLDGLLNVSRLDARLVPVSRRPIALAPLLRELRDEFAGQARAGGGELRIVESAAWIDSDPVLLRRILGNLLSNALRYAPGGKILLGCRRRAGGIEIQVVDQGPGIPPAQQALVFEEFAQLPDVRRHLEQGLGLGLAIVRRLADLLGHTVQLRSEPGRGASFSVRVPRVAAPAAAAPWPAHGGEAVASATLDRDLLGIVLVDDDAQVLAALSELLALWGHTVYAGASAAQARGAHAAARSPAPVHLIVADYRLAGAATGIGAISELRAYLGAAVPALIVTGDTAPARLRELDATGHRILHKPISADLLREAIREVAALPAPARAA